MKTETIITVSKLEDGEVSVLLNWDSPSIYKGIQYLVGSFIAQAAKEGRVFHILNDLLEESLINYVTVKAREKDMDAMALAKIIIGLVEEYKEEDFLAAKWINKALDRMNDSLKKALETAKELVKEQLDSDEDEDEDEDDKETTKEESISEFLRHAANIIEKASKKKK